MNIVSIENISKTYGDKVLFENISFGIEHNDKIGVIGVNGTGKSTLLKIIGGMETVESGKITIGNQIRVQYLPQNPNFQEKGTVLEEVFKGESKEMQILAQYESILEQMQRETDAAENERLQKRLLEYSEQIDALGLWDAEAHAKMILTKLGIYDFSAEVKNLSGGQRKRVAMARAFIQPADLLILDEPTNHIDNDTVAWLEDYLAKRKGALLLITHDRYFLDRVVNRIIELDKGNLYSYEGNYGVFLEKKAEREEQAVVSEQKRQNLLRRELAWLHRGAKARSTKQKAHIQRIEALQDIEFEMPAGNIDIAISSHRLGKKVIEINNISKAYGDRTLVENFSYTVSPQERLGIVGANGQGKSTLLNMMAGRIKADQGSVEIGETVRLAYYTQENQEMDVNMRVIDYIKEAAEYIHTKDGKVITASQMLERFLFPANVQWTPIMKLSGGERRRLYLLRTLMTEPNVLFLDEPTNDLDLQTLTILEEYLDQFSGAVIIVSHDRYFLDRTVDHVLAFEPSGINLYLGGYTDYLERRADEETEAPKVEKKEVQQEKKEHLKKSQPVKLSYKEQKEYDEIEDVIADLEEKLEKVQAEINGVGSDYVALQTAMDKQTKLEEDLENAMDRWAYLTELVEGFRKNK